MDLVEHGLHVLAVGLAHRRERVEQRLILSGGVHAALHAQLLGGFLYPEAGHDHADGADDAGRVGVDLVGGGGDVIGAGGAHIGDRRVQLLIRVLGAQPLDFVEHEVRLHRRTARAVDAQQHRFGVLRLEGVAQPAADQIGAGFGIRHDHAVQVDHRHVGLGHRHGVPGAAAGHHEQQREQIDKGQALEEDAPAAGLALFRLGLAEQLLEQLPLFTGGAAVRRVVVVGLHLHRLLEVCFAVHAE